MVLVTHIPDIRNERAALWDVTGTCNLRCKHCYQYDLYEYEKRGLYPRDLDTANAMAALDRLAEAGVTGIHFLGGEPLLRADLMSLIRAAKSRRIYVSINTNGLPLGRDRTRELIAAGADQVMVSLDGAHPATNDAIRGRGTFEKAWTNLRAANEIAAGTSLVVGIAFTATRSNAHELGDLFALALEQGISLIHIVPVLSAGNFVRLGRRLEDDEDYLLDQLDEALARHAGRLVGRLRIRVDLRLLPIEVLNRRHGAVLEPDPVGVKCQGGRKFVLVQADGRLGACSPSLDPAWSRSATRRGHLDASPEYAHRLPPGGIDESETLRAFYRFQADPATFAGLDPCERCPYYRTLCEPCPLEYPAGNRQVRQCLWAEKAAGRHRQALLRDRLALAHGIALEGDALVRDDGPRASVGETLAALLGEVVDGSSVQAVMDAAFEPPLSEEQRDELLDSIDVLVGRGLVTRDRAVAQEEPCPIAS